MVGGKVVGRWWLVSGKLLVVGRWWVVSGRLLVGGRWKGWVAVASRFLVYSKIVQWQGGRWLVVGGYDLHDD